MIPKFKDGDIVKLKSFKEINYINSKIIDEPSYHGIDEEIIKDLISSKKHYLKITNHIEISEITVYRVKVYLKNTKTVVNFWWIPESYLISSLEEKILKY